MINVGDEFVLHSENGMDYRIKVVNENSFREPDARYACDVFDCNGVYAGDVLFFGDDFFAKNDVEKVNKKSE